MEKINAENLKEASELKKYFVVFKENRKITSKSLSLFLFGQSCCFFDILNPDYMLDNLNISIKNNPKHCDVLIVSDHITNKMAGVLRKVYDDMPFPKWVVAIGSCSSSGCYRNSPTYSLAKGVETIVPVDIKVLGCPVKIETINDVFKYITARD